MEKAGVAVGIEAVAARDGVAVGALHARGAGEGRDEDEKARARQVEVREQKVRRAEAVARLDEERRLRIVGMDAPRSVGGGFEQAERGGADGDDAAALGTRRVDRGGGGWRDVAALGVEAGLREILRAEGKEGAGADMQRDRGGEDAAGAKGGEEILREVKAGGGRGDGARVRGKNRLVVPLVRRQGAGGTGDVRRECEARGGGGLGAGKAKGDAAVRRAKRTVAERAGVKASVSPGWRRRALRASADQEPSGSG